MIAEQLPLLSHDLPPLALRDRVRTPEGWIGEIAQVWAAWMNEYCVYDEHAADALGLALAAAPSVQVVG